MGSEAKRNMGAEGRKDLLLFDPEKLQIITDPKHPLYDPRAKLPIDESLVLNIMMHGVLEPVLCRTNGQTKDGLTRIEVVAGRQRVKANREANKRLVAEGKMPIFIPVTFKRGDDGYLLGVIASENAQRQEVQPVDRAKLAQAMLDAGRTKRDVQICLKLSSSALESSLKLLDLVPEVQEAVATGKIGATLAAQELAKMPREEQPAAYAALVASGATKGEAAKEAAQAIRRNGKPHPDAGPAVRIMGRKQLDGWRKALSKVERKDAEIARAVLGHVLGVKRALADYPHLAEALEAK